MGLDVNQYKYLYFKVFSHQLLFLLCPLPLALPVVSKEEMQIKIVLKNKVGKKFLHTQSVLIHQLV